MADMESIISDSVMAIISTLLLILSWKQLSSSFIVFIFLLSMHIRSLFMALLYLVRGEGLLVINNDGSLTYNVNKKT